MGIETLTRQFETITLTVNIINLILTVSASIAILLVSDNYRDSAISKSLIYFFGSVSQMGIVQLFFLLISLAVIQADPTTVSQIRHFSFYIGIILFLAAIRTVLSISQPNMKRVSSNRMFATVLVTSFISIMMTSMSGFFQSVNSAYILSNRLQESGIYHYAGLVLTIAVMYYNSQINSKITGVLGVIVSPLFYALIALCFIHIFELTAETWMLFSINHTLVEEIEVWLWVPVYICLNYAFWKLYTVLKNNKRL